MRTSQLTPAAATELVERHHALEMHLHSIDDLLQPQEWGMVTSPAVDGEAAHRYMLWRIFDATLPLLVVVMLNPSTATHVDGDRTVDGLVRRARRLGYGGVLVVNCFAFRAREPSDMKKATDPVGPANDDAIAFAVADADVLCAWGVHASYCNRHKEVECLITQKGASLHCLRTTKEGCPEHPLYVPSALGLTPWAGTSANA